MFAEEYSHSPFAGYPSRAPAEGPTTFASTVPFADRALRRDETGKIARSGIAIFLGIMVVAGLLLVSALMLFATVPTAQADQRVNPGLLTSCSLVETKGPGGIYAVHCLDASPANASVSQASRPPDYGCGVNARGTIVCWGDNPSGRVVLPSGPFPQVAPESDNRCGFETNSDTGCPGE